MFSVKSIVFSILIVYSCGHDVSSETQDSVDVYVKNVPADHLSGNGRISSSSNGEGNSVYFTEGLPKNFDARKRWPHCPSIGQVHNQGNCRSSYAIAAATAVSDRICIHSDGVERPVLSAQHIVSCCYMCGYGCRGGSLGESWDFYRRHGFVSGGEYNSSQGCQPYSVPSCSIVSYTEYLEENKCPLTDVVKTPKCETQCYNPTYKKSYRKDFYKGKYYKVTPYMAMKEIYEHGPITTTFTMYKDLVDYRYGVYQYNEDLDPGFFATQSVKIIGWGEEYGMPYWLVVNSFGPEWGNGGTFKISRGADGCLFQEKMFAGLPI